ncbi:unnamed protein product [Somion occarium]|uniref:Short-chain dehydrogenase/reductase n=1 Tax=Somion occarium TaxID=3059160 RepID=A0ABP1CFW1_9APHY
MSKVVLVTGCSKGGIGYALCEAYAAQGCIVYATARRIESMAGFTHPNIHTLKLDVLDDANVQEVVKTIVDKEGRVDILVNNAGAMAAGAMLDQSIDDARRAFETNTFSVLRLAKAVAPHMAQRKSGTIVNIGSVVGEIPTPWNGMYSATKAATHMISDTLWMECKPLGINVTLVVPGAVKSNITANQQAIFKLPEDSLYPAYISQIMRRISSSQGPGSMPSEEFARQVVKKTVRNKPPRYLTLGGRSRLFQFLQWLPRTWALRFFWRVFSKP